MTVGGAADRVVVVHDTDGVPTIALRPVLRLGIAAAGEGAHRVALGDFAVRLKSDLELPRTD